MITVFDKITDFLVCLTGNGAFVFVVFKSADDKAQYLTFGVTQPDNEAQHLNFAVTQLLLFSDTFSSLN